MQNVVPMRERMFTMRLSEEESKRLDRLAEHYGLNAANLIRMLLKKEDGALAASGTNFERLRLTEGKAKKGAKR